MKPPKFSVLLPTYNRADVIGYAIESVLQQTLSDFELLVVGDGCTDNTAAIVQKYAKKDKRVVWHPFPKASGFGYDNRNTVLQKARGEFVAYMGHDDLWLPHHLAVFAEFFRQNPAHLIAYSRPLWMSESGMILPSFFNTNFPYIRDIFLQKQNEAPAICFVVRRSSLIKAGSWIQGTPKAGDWDLWRRIIKLDPKMRLGFLSTPTTINFKSNWRTSEEFLNEHLRVIEEVMEESPELKRIFQLPGKLQLSALQKTAWQQTKNQEWLQKIVQTSVSSQEELLYRLSIRYYRSTFELKRILTFIRWLKSTTLYGLYYIFLKWRAGRK